MSDKSAVWYFQKEIIKITKNNDNNDIVTVTVGTTSYDIPKNMEIYIVQSTSQTSNDNWSGTGCESYHCFR